MLNPEAWVEFAGESIDEHFYWRCDAATE
jgi:hypothetical protein